MSREEDVPAVQLFHGTIVHSTDISSVEVLPDHVLVVKRGRIEHLGPARNLADHLQRTGATAEDVVNLEADQLLIPGFVDAHIHPCQYPNAGLALDLPLLEWLQKYTFPLEARFRDEEFAAGVYETVVERTLRNGTTCASYFGSLHRPATERLAEICRRRGQRALVGKTNMDMNSPEFYIETTDESLQETKAFVEGQLRQGCSLVKPSITPRFAVTCSERLLNGLGELAQKHQLHVQTHLNETIPEKQLVAKLFPNADNYTDVYRRAGLLGPRTVLAHCLHHDDSEIQMMADSGAGVAHCANSNNSLRSGLCDVRGLHKAGISVGLGTDMSGGYHPSVLDSVRATLTTSNIHAIHKEDYEALSFREAFRMATLEGARAIGLGDTIGNFEPGKQLDAVIAHVGHEESNVDILTPHSHDELLQKFVFLGDSRDINAVYVGGRQVISNPTGKSDMGDL